MSLDKSHLNCNSYIVTNSRAIEKQFLNKKHKENWNVLYFAFFPIHRSNVALLFPLPLVIFQAEF